MTRIENSGICKEIQRRSFQVGGGGVNVGINLKIIYYPLFQNNIRSYQQGLVYNISHI